MIQRTMTPDPDNALAELAPEIRGVLARLRARIRRYIWLEGAASVVIWLGLAFWITLLLDWFFEPPVVVRVLALVASAAVLLTILARKIAGRLLVPLADSSMATVLERRFSHLDDALLTAVVLANRSVDPDECNAEMLEQTCRNAVQRVADLPLRDVFNPVPLRKQVLLAAALAASVILFAAVQPAMFGMWAKRSLAMSHELWPRYSRLLVDGFDAQGCVKIARGGEFELVAKADTSWPVVPQVVEVRHQAEGGRRQRTAMSRQGNAAPGRDPFQEFVHKFESVLASIQLDVAGGDAAVRGLRIEVVDSPTINEMQLVVELPSYTASPTQTMPVSGVMQVLHGSRVRVRARSNKPLVRVRVDSVLEDPPPEPIVLEADQLDADRQGFELDLPPLHADKTLQFTLLDADGIQGREATQLRLVAISDAVPQVAVRLHGIGSAVTPKARLPVTGEIRDDYGVARAWFEYAVDQAEAATRAIRETTASATLELSDDALEAADLGLAVGQKLTLAVKAADHFDLAKESNIGTSDRWQLEVVTPDQLRTLLEARELVLRQRFEQIIREATETRDLLARMEFDAKASADDAAPDDAVPDDAVPDDTMSGGDAEEAGKEEAGKEEAEAEQASPMQQLTRRTLRVQRALQNSRKNGHEIKGVADGFDDIERQLINNRVDTEELRSRIAEGIAKPLHAIADQALPELERRLESLQESLDDETLGPARCDRARQQADDVLLAMHTVLQRMIELESFNEAIDMLRQIIALQDELEKQTKERQKQKVLDLLED
ncbi:MAG: hypothetical protein U1E05_02410 [Patescibacteria group bacterium]|nr:hypothetical protein [Patescibacteria group bacterium]